MLEKLPLLFKPVWFREDHNFNTRPHPDADMPSHCQGQVMGSNALLKWLLEHHTFPRLCNYLCNVELKFCKISCIPKIIGKLDIIW